MPEQPLAGITDLISNLFVFLLAMAIVIIVVIILITLIGFGRGSSAASRREATRRTGLEEEVTGEVGRKRRTGISLGESELNILYNLASTEMMPVDSLEQSFGENVSVIAEKLRELEEMGLVEITGGVVTVTRKGKRIAELYHEKYWYKRTEKR